MDLEGTLKRIARGGWPGLRSLDGNDVGDSIRDYADTVATVDIDSAGKVRDPTRVRRLMVALARNVGTEATISTLARDEASLSRDAVREYLEALSRIFVTEDQPAWSARLRSSATLRKEPKRHFCDPSLALALVGGDALALRRDLGFAGQLFESLVAAARSLRSFADNVDSSVSPVLTVVTASGSSYRRSDGINVVAIGSLGP